MFEPATDGLTTIAWAQRARHRRRPVRLTAFGGGTGLPVLLAGLRDRRDVSVTAVVTVADDGGSSGRLRREMGVAPPGDLRNSLVALARDRRLAELFQHRLGDGRELAGHAIGNLVIAGLIARSRDLCAAVQRAGRMLRTNGTVYPASREAVTLIMRGTDGSHLHGESSVEGRSGSVERIEAAAPGARAPRGVLEAIPASDIVVLGPGSLFTSTIASLLGRGTQDALRRFRGPIVYVANLRTQPGETTGFTLADHVRAIGRHGRVRVTHVLVAEELVAAGAGHVAQTPAADGDRPEPLHVDIPALERLGVTVASAPLLAPDATGAVRHDPERLAEAVLAIAHAHVHADANDETPARTAGVTTVEGPAG